MIGEMCEVTHTHSVVRGQMAAPFGRTILFHLPHSKSFSQLPPALLSLLMKQSPQHPNSCMAQRFVYAPLITLREWMVS